MKVNGVRITAKTIRATREHFAGIGRRSIAEAKAGTLGLPPEASIPRYVAWEEGNIARMLSGADDNSLTFLQRALLLQTGDAPALLA